jgi:hypothetical protein
MIPGGVQVPLVWIVIEIVRSGVHRMDADRFDTLD